MGFRNINDNYYNLVAHYSDKDVLFASTSQDIQNRPVNLRNMVRPKTS